MRPPGRASTHPAPPVDKAPNGAVRSPGVRLARSAVAAIWIATAGVWVVAGQELRASSAAPPTLAPAPAPAQRAAAPPALPPPSTASVARPPARAVPAAQPTTSTTAPIGNCRAAIARSRVPLRAGWTESCTPAWPGDDGGRAIGDTRTLHYAEAALDRAAGGDPLSAWTYIVAHERCHALAHGTPAFLDEQAVDRCAGSYGAAVDRWSVY